MECVALSNGIDGTLLRLSFTAVGGIVALVVKS